jgi:hypothetical protein
MCLFVEADNDRTAPSLSCSSSRRSVDAQDAQTAEEERQHRKAEMARQAVERRTAIAVKAAQIGERARAAATAHTSQGPPLSLDPSKQAASAAAVGDVEVMEVMSEESEDEVEMTAVVQGRPRFVLALRVRTPLHCS